MPEEIILNWKNYLNIFITLLFTIVKKLKMTQMSNNRGHKNSPSPQGHSVLSTKHKKNNKFSKSHVQGVHRVPKMLRRGVGSVSGASSPSK